jgi:hypothetical protein
VNRVPPVVSPVVDPQNCRGDGAQASSTKPPSPVPAASPAPAASAVSPASAAPGVPPASGASSSSAALTTSAASAAPPASPASADSPSRRRSQPGHSLAPARSPLSQTLFVLCSSLLRRALAPPADERAWTRALLAICIAATVWLFAQILLYRYGRDQGIYACVADAVLRGGMPYRDAWDFKPPGIFVVYALTRALFGSGQWCIRLVEVLGLASMTGAFVVLARRFFRDGRIGLIAGVLAALVHAQLEFWHTAQPESFGGIFIVWAMVLATYEPAADDAHRGRKELFALVGCGALYAAAGLLKPPLIGGVAVSAVFVFLRRRRSAPEARPALASASLGAPAAITIPSDTATFRSADAVSPTAARTAHPSLVGSASLRASFQDWVRAAVSVLLPLTAGSVFTIALCALWFVAGGAWSALYETLFVFTPHYARLGWEGVSFPGLYYLAAEQWIVGYSSINAVGLFAALLMRPVSAREREGVLHTLGVVFIQLVGVGMQRKFFPYHYGSTLPLGAFLAALGAMKLWQAAVARGVAGVTSYGVIAYIVLLGRTATRDTQTDFMDRCLTRQAWLLGTRSPSDRDAMDGKLYSVADVNYEANHRVAVFLREHLGPDETVFIWGFEPIIYDMADRRPASRYLYDVPQRVSWFRQEAQDRLMADLSAHRPAAIVVEHHDVFPVVTGSLLDSADSLRSFPALARRLDEDYALEVTIEDFDVYMARR